MSIYFSCPDGHPWKDSISRALREEFGTVIESPSIKASNCTLCMNELEVKAFPLIDKCDKLATFQYQDSCRLDCELYYAALEGKKLYLVEISLDLEDIDIEPISLKEYSIIRRYK